jgi:class 3 adenylate cyclase
VSEAAEHKAKYSAYCREHEEEFAAELCDQAASLIRGWVGRVFVVVVIALTLWTTPYAATTEEILSTALTILACSFPALLVMSYPLAVAVYSPLRKYSPLILDVICLSTLLSFVVFAAVFLSASSDVATGLEVSDQLVGQVNFVLLIVIAPSYHASYQLTVLRNLMLALLFAAMLFLADRSFFHLSILQLMQGFLLGSAVSWFIYKGMRASFYSKSTDADAREHLRSQLSKLVYPHQLQMIKRGEELEATMPLKEGKAIVSVFDVQRSSEIKNERTPEFFIGVFEAFLGICMRGYEHSPLRSQAFRLKETGDGFISTVGYPFLPSESRSLADSAVSTALSMFDVFNKEVEKFNYSRPIKAAIGLAYNSIQGTFQSGSIRSYDLFGDAIVQAAKYEELRKEVGLWAVFEDCARRQGFTDFHVLIIQEVVYNSLSPAYRDIFSEVDLVSMPLDELRVDPDARYVYFHVLE